MAKTYTADLTASQFQEIISQALNEISFARRYKNGKVSNWQKNEELYFGRKQTGQDARANVDLGKMQEFVHTLLSKVDNPLVFNFTKRKEAQLKRVQRLNSLRAIDQQLDFWDIKDLVGKKQAILYGRSIFAYYADSEKGYKAHLEPVDVYDFLIDPSAGGVDIERARYMGRYGIILDRDELQSKEYLKDQVKNLLQGVGNNTEKPQEEINKDTRRDATNTIGEKELQTDDKFKFWGWFTTFKGVRYYLVMQENGACIRCERLDELFTPTKEFPKGAYPFWTWAVFPDLTEFWTPSYCDYVRESFMAQNVSINQMLDNAEQVNKPQKVVNVGAIENLAQLKYRKDGIILTKGDYDANRAIQLLKTPSINTPIQVYNLLEAISEKATGVTAGAKGVADEEGKVGIYEGNQQATADRFDLLNKSYAFGYHRFARLYEIGVRDHLTKKVAIDMIGPDGIESEEVSRKDIFRKADLFGVMVDASNAEKMTSALKQKQKMTFLMSQINNPKVNQTKLFEIMAKASEISEDEIKQLQDVSVFGDQELMAEAERDLELLLELETIKPNQNANNAYKQKIVNYLKNQQENMTDEQFANISKYLMTLEEIIYKNEARALSAYENELASQPPAIGGSVMALNNNPEQTQNDEEITSGAETAI